MNDDILLASRELKNDGVVVLPTETVYGLAANALSPKAVEKIFEIKGRPLNDPLILHVLNSSWIEQYAHVENYLNRIKKITSRFWPGPITIVLPKKDIIPDIVTAGHNTVAIRCPKHPICQEVLRITQFPLAAPSANPFGYVSPTSAGQVRQTLGNKVNIIIDGGQCSVGLESTILDITQKTPKILRPGAITADEIAKVLEEEVADYGAQIISNSPKTPGQLKQHYCTNTKLGLFEHHENIYKIPQNSGSKVAIIFTQKPTNLEKITNRLSISAENIFWLSEKGEQEVIARNLFAMLQKLDSGQYDVILCERPMRQGVGIAIDDRLLRAAAKFNKGPTNK
ncbi:MAG: threonylcarbamoyl-AMP synthase [Holosporaceae bacterium]|jgi:L-threonylcarbamoyladenylate synthase|nr:threonylcarbamoyl-AMP synthase [Holosporaceae bacterium]